MSGAVREFLKAYNPKEILRSLSRLDAVHLRDRMMFMLFLSNASVSYNPYILASIGVAFGGALGTSIMAVFALGFQFGKALLPFFRSFKMSQLLKLLAMSDVLSILIIVSSVALGNDIILIIGLDVLGILCISMQYAYGIALKKYMSRDGLREYIEEYEYTFNSLDIYLKVIITTSIALTGIMLPKLGLFLAVVLISASLHYQVKFIKTVASQGY